MSAVAAPASTCSCQTIGSVPEIRQCPDHWTYWYGDKRLTSVGRVIETLMPFDDTAMAPAVLANAKQRGKFVDVYFEEFLRGVELISLSDVPAMVEPYFIADQYRTAEQHAQDVARRIELLLEWWTAKGWKAIPQHIFYSIDDGVAGKCDLVTEDKIIDLKCVSSLMPVYSLQLGAYCSYDTQSFPRRDPAILHVQKDKVRFVPYEANVVKRQWEAAFRWFSTARELNPASRKELAQ